MLEVYFFGLIVLLHILSAGWIFYTKILKLKNEQKNIFIIILKGFVFLSFISLLANFFIPLNKFYNNLLLLSLIYYFIDKDLKILVQKNYLVILSIPIFFLLQISFDNFNRPDAYLYHLPYTNILNESKVVIGVYNLHYRFAHVSIFQYMSAIYYNNILGLNGIAIPLGIFYSTVFFYFTFNSIKNNNKKLSNLFSLTILIFLATGLNRYSGLGNDAPAHLTYFIIINELLKINLDKKDKFEDLSKILILSSFSFLNKISLALVFILIFFIIIKKIDFKDYIVNKIFNTNFRAFFFIITFITLWLFKNFLVSGCLAFPIKQTCFSGIYWHDSFDTDRRSNATIANYEVEAWAKAISDSPHPQKKFDEYIKDFGWIKIWAKGHGKVILNKIFPLLLFLFFLLIFIKKKNITYKNNKIIDIILIFNFLFSLIWFLKFPTFRYGTGYIITFIILMFIKYSKVDLSINYNHIFFFKKIILIVFILLNLKYLAKFDFNFEKNIWPAPFNGDYKEIESYKINNNIIFFAKNSLCGYYKSPCTNQVYFAKEHNNHSYFYYKDLNMKKIFNYQIFFFKE